MRIIAKKALVEYSIKYPDVKSQLESWHSEVKCSDWNSPNDIKVMFPKARIIGKDRVIFNIANNKHRLIILVNFKAKIVYIRFLGTHKEYDKINVEEI